MQTSIKSRLSLSGKRLKEPPKPLTGAKGPKSTSGNEGAASPLDQRAAAAQIDEIDEIDDPPFSSLRPFHLDCRFRTTITLKRQGRVRIGDHRFHRSHRLTPPRRPLSQRPPWHVLAPGSRSPRASGTCPASRSVRTSCPSLRIASGSELGGWRHLPAPVRRRDKRRRSHMLLVDRKRCPRVDRLPATPDDVLPVLRG